jgi:hemin uptake protein HemP
MNTTRLKIAKLTADTDVAHLEKSLEAVPLVESAEIDPGAHEAIIRHDGADLEQLTAALRSQGYISEAV